MVNNKFGKTELLFPSDGKSSSVLSLRDKFLIPFPTATTPTTCYAENNLVFLPAIFEK